MLIEVFPMENLLCREDLVPWLRQTDQLRPVEKLSDLVSRKVLFKMVGHCT